MKNSNTAAAFLILATGFAPLGAMDLDFAGSSYKAAPVAVSAPAPVKTRSAAPKVKEWTVMVFINGKNNLERPGCTTLTRWRKSAPTPTSISW